MSAAATPIGAAPPPERTQGNGISDSDAIAVKRSVVARTPPHRVREPETNPACGLLWGFAGP